MYNFEQDCLLFNSLYFFSLAHPLQDAGDGEDGGWRHLRPVLLDGGEQLLRGGVEPVLDGAEALSVGRPQHDHLVHAARRAEVADVGADLQEEGGREVAN